MIVLLSALAAASVIAALVGVLAWLAARQRWRCRRCGTTLRRLRPDDFTADRWRACQGAGVAALVAGHGWRCDGCGTDAIIA